MHILRRAALGTLVKKDVVVPEPHVGVVEFLRQLEGVHPPPTDNTPLGIVGLEALCHAAGVEAPEVLQSIRARIHEARRYLDRHGVPLCFVIDSPLEPDTSSGPVMVTESERTPIHLLAGSGLQQMTTDATWWWTPQVG
ncbi:MAG: hypothetical protein H6726_32320 [Sandaracinaceae bacterium]|nr:hypothetical protein [Sandaracinaceae bacterium]